MTTSKSPRKVLAEALATAEACLPLYAHKYAPKSFTQPQLFACLVLKEFEKKDYRGVAQLLADCPDLRQVIGLHRRVPHFTTLHKACRRLLRLPRVRPLLEHSVQRIHRRQSRRGKLAVPRAAGDSSGFDAHHASRYFIWRRDNQKDTKPENRPKKRHSYKRFGKLMVIINTCTHAILAAVASEGPTPDIDQLDQVVLEVPFASLSIRTMALDAGFDSAHNHRLLREDHAIRSLIPPEYGRPPKDPTTLPPDPYRRLMKQRYFKPGARRPAAYRQRAQAETVFSMLKRNLGPALRGRSVYSRRRDLYLKVLTHNITLAANV